MPIAYRLWRFALLCFLAVWSLTSVRAQTKPNRLIMISVDGMRSLTLRNAEKLGLQIPNLKAFRDGGATSEGLVGVFPTVTYPSHTTMVTGRRPAEHGITGNVMFDPERQMRGAWFWYTEQIKVPTLWDAARAAGMSTGAVAWPVGVGAPIDFNVPEYRSIRTLDDVLIARAMVTPGLLQEFEKSTDRLTSAVTIMTTPAHSRCVYPAHAKTSVDADPSSGPRS